MTDHTTIRVSHETRRNLILMGKMGESYDDVIRKMIAAVTEEEKGK